MSDTGRPPAVTPEQVLEVFREREDPAEPLTAPEVAERLDCSRRTALDRLHELAEGGEIVSKKVGGRSLVWWIPGSPPGDDPGIVEDDPLFTGAPLDGEPMGETETIDDVVYGQE